MHVAVDVDEAWIVEFLHLASPAPVEAEVEGVVGGEGEEVMRDRIVVWKLDGRSDGNREDMRQQHFSAGHHLEFAGSEFRDTAGDRLQPDEGFGGDRILAAFCYETDPTADIAGRD